MLLTFHPADFHPSTSLFTSYRSATNPTIVENTDNTMTIGGSTAQNRGNLSSKTLHVQEHKRNWTPRKHQRNDKLSWTKQNNQSRAVGKMFGDKQRMDAVRDS